MGIFSNINSMAFLDYMNCYDVNSCFNLKTPFFGKVGSLKNGPITGSCFVFNIARENIPETFQVVLSNDKIYSRLCVKGNIPQRWNTYIDSSSLETLISNVDYLQKQVELLKTPDPVYPEFNNEERNITVDGDAVINGTKEPMVGKSSVIAKSINMSNISVESGVVVTVANNDIEISKMNFSGDCDKTTMGNAQMIVNCGGFVKISDSDFKQTGYNTIEVGLNSKPKSIYINNINFEGTLANNAIGIHNIDNNGTIIISNCTFNDVSNVLRFTNPEGNKVNIKFVNCYAKKWELSTQYSGMIIMQDNISKSGEDYKELNPFGSDKVSVEIENCYGPNGKLVSSNMDKICASGDSNQLIYVYVNKRQPHIVPYSEKFYPKISII